MQALLFTDGGARGNPGPAGIGVVLQAEDGTTLAEIARGIARTTNNVAEYRALIAGLELALEHGVTHLEILCDSALIVHQVRGEWKIKKEHLRPLAVKAQILLNRFDEATLGHVHRAGNARADELANIGMDEAEASGATESRQASLLEE